MEDATAAEAELLDRADKLFVAVLNGMLVRADIPMVERGNTPDEREAIVLRYASMADSALLMTLTALERADKMMAYANKKHQQQKAGKQ